MTRTVCFRVVATLLALTAGVAPAVVLASRADAVDVHSPPRISIGGGSIVEGDMNRRYIRFTVALSWASSAPVTVEYATGDPGDTATAGSDYLAKTGTVVFTPGQRQHTVSVKTTVDYQTESDETVTMRLSNPTGATIAFGEAIGVILNDDPSPGRRASVGDTVVPEGCVGNTTATVPVMLSRMSGSVEVVHLSASSAPVAGALPLADYKPFSKDITFSVGQVFKEILIPIYADLVAEGNETIDITITSVSGPTPILRSQATVTILDCDPT